MNDTDRPRMQAPENFEHKTLTLIEAVSCARQHVVHLIRHAATLADKADRAGPVQLAGDDVVQGSGCVADLEGTSLARERGKGGEQAQASATN
jgi:hypothetical protein